MAIPSRQIGGSTRTSLLWQISKQLEQLICVRAGGCPTTTSTTTTISYYYYSGSNCNSPLFGQVIRNIIPLSIGDVVLATDGNCYIIGGVYVGPDYSVEYISTETCFVDPCPTTTTTTSTISPDTIVNSTNKFVNCPAICPQACPNPQVYFDVWMTYNCALFFPEIGCAIWLDEAATIPFPDGSYNKGYGVCLTITGGIITADQ